MSAASPISQSGGWRWGRLDDRSNARPSRRTYRELIGAPPAVPGPRARRWRCGPLASRSIRSCAVASMVVSACAWGSSAPRIERLTVRFEDVNGPRGGKDVACRIKAVVSGLPSTLVTELAANPAKAFDRAGQRLERVLRDAIGRGRESGRLDRLPPPAGDREQVGSARRKRITSQHAGDAPEPQSTPAKGDICARGLDAASPVAQIHARERQPRQARQQARPAGTPARIFAQRPAGPGRQGALSPAPRDR